MGTRFDTVTELLDLVCAIPRLEALTISNIIISSGGPVLTPFLETGSHIPPTLQELWLTTEWTMKILEWLQQHPHSYHNLTKFTVGVGSSVDVHTIAEFLKTVGLSLEELHIFAHREQLFVAINLSHNTNLRELELFLRGTTSLAYITSALAQINVSCIQKITIEQVPDLFSDIAQTSAFQQLILELALTRLTLFVMLNSRHSITEQLPELAKRGVRFAS